MKILLATDGSAHSKAMVKKFAERTFAATTKVRIISAYEGSSYMMNTASMGVLSGYYGTTDNASLQFAEDASESAATILLKKNPKLSVAFAAIDGSAKSNPGRSGKIWCRLNCCRLTRPWCSCRISAWFCFPGSGITCKMFCIDCTK